MKSDLSRQNTLKNRLLRISCVIPAHNEQDNLAPFVAELSDTLRKHTDAFELLIIDDGSKDNTLAIAEELSAHYPVKLVSLSRNFGKEIAITAGLEHVSGDVTIIIDADHQHPLETVDAFIAKWAEGFDMVYGVRQNRDNESFIKRFFTGAFYRLMKALTKTDMPANAGDFRLLDRKVVDALNQCDERHRFMKGLYCWVGFNSIAVPYEALERAAGVSSWSFRHLLELAITGITTFSSIPLRVWGFVGFAISLISFGYASWIIIDTLVYGVDLPGFATLVVAVMFFGGIQLLSIGIIGEYIGRIFDEVKHRPKYLIDKKTGFTDDGNS